jgi:hypothetical protein
MSNPPATNVFNRVVRVDTFDECDAMMNCRTGVFNDGVTARKRIGITECYQDESFREHVGFFHRCIEVAAAFAELQEISNHSPGGRRLLFLQHHTDNCIGKCNEDAEKTTPKRLVR